MAKVGDRVGAISHTDDDKAFVFGFGIYEGDFVPPKEVGGFNLGLPNPRIKLDNGKIVYGCECWWGAEDKVKESLQKQNKQIIDVDIDEERARQAVTKGE